MMLALRARRRRPCLLSGAVLMSGLVLNVVVATQQASAQLGGDTTPSRAYFAAIDELYEGEYRDAERTFTRELRGAIKTVDARWIDSICYYAMLGETYFQQGRPRAALEQFDLAADMYLQYPKWLLQVDFNQPPQSDPTLSRRIPPWGNSGRQFVPGRFRSSMKISQGSLNVQEQVRRGGVIRQAQYWQINVIEVLRCTALTIRRRNELLGPLASYDPISKAMRQQLARGGAPPNHWANAWVDVLRGLAHSGAGEHKQAMQRLQRGTLLAGQFDHPLTCVALLEQGRLVLDAGTAPAEAAKLFAEAGYSAFLYEDLNVIDESLRLGQQAFATSGGQAVNPALLPMANWSMRRYPHIAARAHLAIAESQLAAGNLNAAAAALKTGQGRLARGAQVGRLANWSLYLQARLEYELGRDTAPATLAKAVGDRTAMSLRNYQTGMANEMFDARTLTTRQAVEVYPILLRDPTPADAVFQPLETLTVMKTPHDLAFNNWLLAALERKDDGRAIEVADLHKRRHFHQAMPWGGRLMALRQLLGTPAEQLDGARRQQQSDLLLKFPSFMAAEKQALGAREEIDKLWHAEMTDDQQRDAVRLWRSYSEAIDAREAQLGSLGLRRVPVDYAFPPVAQTAKVQSQLRPGQALLVFHDTPDGMLGFLFTSQASRRWNCGPSGRLEGQIASYLRELGNYDGNREITPEQLNKSDWQAAGEIMFKTIFKDSSFDPASTQELIVVPDGALWYVPFEALVAETEPGAPLGGPLITQTKIRYSPTVGLAFPSDKLLGAERWRRVRRTGVLAGELLPGETDEQRQATLDALTTEFDGTLDLQAVPARGPQVASLIDWLLVLNDVEASAAAPLATTPLPVGRRPAVLAEWMTLSGSGPQRVFLPGLRTAAESGGKTSRRRKTPSLPGSELFYASCALQYAGAETILLSRWRVGGQSTLDLMREFTQELPYSDASHAWQRSVQLARETPLDPLTEPRVKSARGGEELTAAHPFFWAGYLVIDLGQPGPEAGEDEPKQPVAEPPAGL